MQHVLRPFNEQARVIDDCQAVGACRRCSGALRRMLRIERANRPPCLTYRRLIYPLMIDEAMRRLLDYDGRRYWLPNGWSVRFRVMEVGVTAGRPHGVKYAFTLHDADRTRLLGFDNAHGVPRAQAYDHRHRFRRPAELVPYDFQGADELICDFFAAVEQACRREGVPFEFEVEDVDHEVEADDGEGLSG